MISILMLIHAVSKDNYETVLIDGTITQLPDNDVISYLKRIEKSIDANREESRGEFRTLRENVEAMIDTKIDALRENVEAMIDVKIDALRVNVTKAMSQNTEALRDSITDAIGK